jgi:F-type H+-transporting ATPase subunit epsilon
MRVAVYSLEKIIYEGETSAVNAKTLAGEITVLDKHRPLIAVLTEGVIRITDKTEGEKFFNIKGGFLEVEPTHSVRLLVEAA